MAGHAEQPGHVRIAGVSPVNYRVVYDVLDAPPRIGLGPVLLALAALWTAFWMSQAEQ